jgi:hypothetical protein
MSKHRCQHFEQAEKLLANGVLKPWLLIGMGRRVRIVRGMWNADIWTARVALMDDNADEAKESSGNGQTPLHAVHEAIKKASARLIVDTAHKG